MLYSTDIEQLKLVCPKAHAFIASHDMLTLEDGSYDLGDDECVNVMSYTAKDRAGACYESHDAYADIQVSFAGEEEVEVAPRKALEVTQPYNEKGDCTLYSNKTAGERYRLCPGRFLVLMPEDPHMPSLACGDVPAQVKKAVFKIKAESLA